MVAHFELWFYRLYQKNAKIFPELLIFYGGMTATMFCGCSQHRRHQSRTKTVKEKGSLFHCLKKAVGALSNMWTTGNLSIQSKFIYNGIFFQRIRAICILGSFLDIWSASTQEKIHHRTDMCSTGSSLLSKLRTYSSYLRLSCSMNIVSTTHLMPNISHTIWG